MTLAGAAVLLLAVAQPHVTRAELAVTFVGNAAFHITDGQVAILTDFPYDPGEHFMHWSPEGVPQRPTNPLCLSRTLIATTSLEN